MLPPARARHVVEQYLALLEPLGVTEPKVDFALPWSAAAEARADAFFAAFELRPRQRVVVLNPGAGRPRKRWPVERFAELAGRLTRDAFARVVVAWGPGFKPQRRQNPVFQQFGNVLAGGAPDDHADHMRVDRHIMPALAGIGRAMGFAHVQASPLTRSSYHAWEQSDQAKAARNS